jgi:hypothetical protein
MQFVKEEFLTLVAIMINRNDASVAKNSLRQLTKYFI